MPVPTSLKPSQNGRCHTLIGQEGNASSCFHSSFFLYVKKTLWSFDPAKYVFTKEWVNVYSHTFQSVVEGLLHTYTYKHPVKVSHSRLNLEGLLTHSQPIRRYEIYIHKEKTPSLFILSRVTEGPSTTAQSAYSWSYLCFMKLILPPYKNNLQ